MADESRFYKFVGGDSGRWTVISNEPVLGEGLAEVRCVDVQNSNLTHPPMRSQWSLRGVTSHPRYLTRPEQNLLRATQPPTGRAESICAALIAITKSPQWWLLTQDERREIFETRSSHIAVGQRYLPAIARRLHHSRDLGEPFDFLTWFEFAPDDRTSFDELVDALRRTEEWTYVEREVDIRLWRNEPM